jgi:hypothetical protein
MLNFTYMHQLKYYLHVICEGMSFLIIIILFFICTYLSHFFNQILILYIYIYIYIYTSEVVISDKDALNQHGKIM